MNAAAQWQDYTPPESGGWQDYEPEPERKASSPIAAPKMTVGAPSAQPMAEHYLLGGEEKRAIPEELGELGGGMLESAGHMATAAPVAIHRALQRRGIVPQGNLYPGEHTTEQLEKEDVPNAVLTTVGGMEGEAAPVEARAPRAIPETPSPKPSGGRSPVLAVARHLPYIGKYVRAGEMLGDLFGGKGSPTPTVAKPIPIPETEGIPWGSGGQGPLDLRGKSIPAESPRVPAPRPAPAWRTAPTEGTEVPSVINRQPYAQPGRAIPEAPPTAKPPRPAPAWKTSPTEGTPVESVINRQPVAQAPKPRPIPEVAPEVQTAAAPAPETTLAKPPARIVKQAAALGPNAKVLTQAESLGHAIPEAAPAAEAENPYPKGAASERYAAENPNIIKLWQQGAGFESPEVEDVGIRARAATEQQMGPLERGAGRAIPEMPPEIRYVPSTNEIRQSLPEVKARTRADMMEDRAIQQEQAAQLEEQGRRARSEQLRRDIAGSSTGVTKGDLVRGARTPQPIPEAAQDLAPEWQAELDRRIAAKKAKHPRP